VHTEVLTAAQLRVLDGLTATRTLREFYLAGGTALALRHCHRRSMEFFRAEATRLLAAMTGDDRSPTRFPRRGGG
jgi:hypothetical protein